MQLDHVRIAAHEVIPNLLAVNLGFVTGCHVGHTGLGFFLKRHKPRLFMPRTGLYRLQERFAKWQWCEFCVQVRAMKIAD